MNYQLSSAAPVKAQPVQVKVASIEAVPMGDSKNVPV